MNNQQAQDSIGYWEVKWNYKHPRKVYASHYCCERLPYGNFHCASPYCSDHCHRWEGKHYTRMKEGEDMNMYRLILPVGDIVPPPVLSSIWENFGRRLRWLFPGCEWYWVLELQNGNLHLHVLLKADGPVTYQEVNDKWRKTLKRRGLEIAVNTVSVKAVGDEPDDYANVCSYNTKSRRAKPWEYRPPSGLYRNLAFASRGFYDKEPVVLPMGHYHDTAHQYVSDNLQLGA